MWDTGLFFVVNADYIEAPLALRGKPAQEISNYGCDFTPFVLIDRSFSRLYVARAARFHFDKAKNIVLPADQVDLSPATRRTKVARGYRITEFAQMEVCGLFAASAGDLVSGRFLSRKRLIGEPVEGSDSCEDDCTREHGLLSRTIWLFDLRNDEMNQKSAQGWTSQRCCVDIAGGRPDSPGSRKRNETRLARSRLTTQSLVRSACKTETGRRYCQPDFLVVVFII
jgi:hypothetical protein